MKGNTKKMLVCITMIAIIIAHFTLVTFLFMSNANTQYTAEGQVVTTLSNGYCAVVDSNGEQWGLYTDAIIQHGDEVILIIDNMDTENIYDDEIIGMKRK